MISCPFTPSMTMADMVKLLPGCRLHLRKDIYEMTLLGALPTIPTTCRMVEA
jgi:hypothetical protein